MGGFSPINPCLMSKSLSENHHLGCLYFEANNQAINVIKGMQPIPYLKSID
ncbi:hypothetical protein Xsto_04156 [Xenorhabdus stockiae]|uniref:Uncharacterized protein n=1 Tax=Xenorhabdus stockiae TaxID=351614 RepID=A0A2D0K313_9GAMM|nr:hypothetical protein Xsto_04156 [Xenorhabdus stockiae]